MAAMAIIIGEKDEERKEGKITTMDTGTKRAKRANSKEKERKEKAKGKMANGTIE